MNNGFNIENENTFNNNINRENNANSQGGDTGENEHMTLGDMEKFLFSTDKEVADNPVYYLKKISHMRNCEYCRTILKKMNNTNEKLDRMIKIINK